MNHNLDHTRPTLRERNFKSFGVDWLCYVKCVTWSGRREYVVHGADGTYLWRYDDRATADAALRQCEMESLSVH